MAMKPLPECVWPLGAELGEGPVWYGDAVWFVDIKGQRIHCFSPGGRKKRSWAAPASPGFLVPARDGAWRIGLKTGLHSFDPETGDFTHLCVVEAPDTDNRLNDGAVDAKGGLWFGSMHDPETAPSGRLYRYDAAGLTACDGGYRVTNGPAFSPDGSLLYHTDTLARTIYVFDMSEDGVLTNKRIFVVIAAEHGYPDGPAVDVHGCVWTGLFGGWGVLRFSPAGEILEKIEFPVANVTKLAFGGADLRTAYATTASMGLSPEEHRRQPLAGGLFSFRTDVSGLPQNEVHHG